MVLCRFFVNIHIGTVLIWVILTLYTLIEFIIKHIGRRRLVRDRRYPADHGIAVLVGWLHTFNCQLSNFFHSGGGLE